MPAKLKYGLLCDGAMTVYGKATYQGVFTTITSPIFPAGVGQAALCFKFSGPVGAHTFRIQLADSQGKPVGPEYRQAIDCREFMDNEVIADIRPLVLPAPGFFCFKLFLDDDKTPFGEIELQGMRINPIIEAKPGGA